MDKKENTNTKENVKKEEFAKKVVKDYQDKLRDYYLNEEEKENERQ